MPHRDEKIPENALDFIIFVGKQGQLGLQGRQAIKKNQNKRTKEQKRRWLSSHRLKNIPKEQAVIISLSRLPCNI